MSSTSSGIRIASSSSSSSSSVGLVRTFVYLFFFSIPHNSNSRSLYNSIQRTIPTTSCFCTGGSRIRKRKERNYRTSSTFIPWPTVDIPQKRSWVFSGGSSSLLLSSSSSKYHKNNKNNCYRCASSTARVRPLRMMQNTMSSTTTTATTAKSPSYPWCCVATTTNTNIQTNNKSQEEDLLAKSIQIEKVTGSDNNDDTQKGLTSSNLDITNSADWMEYIETIENRQNDEGGAGAYDTFRCDYVPTQKKWNLWGDDFHIQRLENSYSSLVQLIKEKEGPNQQDDNSNNDKTNSRSTATKTIPPEIRERAIQQSRKIVNALLKEAEIHFNKINKESDKKLTNDSNSDTKIINDPWIQMVKLTLLWSRPKRNSDSSATASKEKNHDSIIVRGHACCSCKLSPIHRNVDPIIVSIAIPQQQQQDGIQKEQAASVVPSRFHSPQNKVASWCRLRRQLEKPIYKPKGGLVSEVLMVKPYTTTDTTTDSNPIHNLEILEGLSSNFFVIYKDGTIRTPKKGVLHGYARHLVLQYCKKCGLEYPEDDQPILLQDAKKGLWSEAFITSSSRLIYPISRILIPSTSTYMQTKEESIANDSVNNDYMHGFSELWRDDILIKNYESSSSKTTNPIITKQKWQFILDEILKHGGY